MNVIYEFMAVGVVWVVLPIRLVVMIVSTFSVLIMTM